MEWSGVGGGGNGGMEWSINGIGHSRSAWSCIVILVQNEKEVVEWEGRGEKGKKGKGKWSKEEKGKIAVKLEGMGRWS